MQPVNDDMNELFRRAAENYPLNTSGADWNKVLQGLNAAEGKDVPPKEKKKRRYLLFLFLVPLLIATGIYIGININKQPVVVVTGNDANARIEKKGEVIKAPITDPGTVHTNDDKNAVNNQTTVQQDATSGDIIMSQKKNSSGRLTRSVLPASKEEQVTFIQRRQSKLNRQIIEATSVPGKNDEVVISHKENEKLTSIPVISKVVTNRANATAGNTDNNKKSTDQLIIETGKGVQREATQLETTTAKNGEQEKSNLNVNQPAIDNIINTVKSPLDGTSTSLKGQQVVKEKKFYIALMGGIDATNVKGQRVDRASFDYGFIAGYQLNRKWSIEAGAFMDKKYYYSDGKYFNNGKITVPANAVITEVTGDCRMLDIPISVKYNIRSFAKSSVFATTGITSYIMKQEDYESTYYYPATNYYHEYFKTYNNSSKHFASNLQLSAGYTHKLGKVGDIRIEPYVKIPLKGVGIGTMPLTSTGIHVGLTRKMF